MSDSDDVDSSNGNENNVHDRRIQAMDNFFAAIPRDQLRHVFDENGRLPPMGDPTKESHEIFEALPDATKKLYLELADMFDANDQDSPMDEARVAAILSMDEIDPNVKVLPYGETFLSASIFHGFTVLKLLLDHGADPNLENDMAGETAYDQLEEDDDRSEQEQKMMDLLVQKGALSYEDRMALVTQQMSESFSK